MLERGKMEESEGQVLRHWYVYNLAMSDVPSPLFQDSQPSHSTVFPPIATCSPQCLRLAPLPHLALRPHTAPLRNRRPSTCSRRKTCQPSRRIDTKVRVPFFFLSECVLISSFLVADCSSILLYADEKLELKADKEEPTVCSLAKDESTTSKRSLLRFLKRRGNRTDSPSGTSSLGVEYVPRKLLYPSQLSSLAFASRVALPGDCPTPRARLRKTRSSKRPEPKRPDVLF